MPLSDGFFNVIMSLFTQSICCNVNAAKMNGCCTHFLALPLTLTLCVNGPLRGWHPHREFWIHPLIYYLYFCFCRLHNHKEEETFSVRIIHSIPLRMSVVEVMFQNRMAAVAHLVGCEQLPLPEMVRCVVTVSCYEISGGFRISRRGAPTSWGGANSRGAYVSKSLHIETKESRPLGGRPCGAPWIRQWRCERSVCRPF